jgi:hypothetical protein
VIDTVGLYRDGTWRLTNEHIDMIGPDGPTVVTALVWGTQ